MHLEDTDKFKIISKNLIIERKDFSGSTPVDPSFIKEKLGFLESIINKIYSLFSDNYWKPKTVTLQESNGSTSQKTMYVLATKLSIPLSNKLSTPKSSSPKLDATTRLIQSSSTTSTRAASSSSNPSYTRAQLTKIADANRLYEWIGKLKDPTYTIKCANRALSIEPPRGVQHQNQGIKQFNTDTAQSTGAYNLLACTSSVLASINPKQWNASDASDDATFNYGKYIEACNGAINTLNKKPSKSPDDEINLGLINAGLILAKGFEQILNGSTKTAKTFEASTFHKTILTNYLLKFFDFGTIRPQ